MSKTQKVHIMQQPQFPTQSGRQFITTCDLQDIKPVSTQNQKLACTDAPTHIKIQLCEENKNQKVWLKQHRRSIKPFLIGIVVIALALVGGWVILKIQQTDNHKNRSILDDKKQQTFNTSLEVLKQQQNKKNDTYTASVQIPGKIDKGNTSNFGTQNDQTQAEKQSHIQEQTKAINKNKQNPQTNSSFIIQNNKNKNSQQISIKPIQKIPEENQNQNQTQNQTQSQSQSQSQSKTQNQLQQQYSKKISHLHYAYIIARYQYQTKRGLSVSYKERLRLALALSFVIGQDVASNPQLIEFVCEQNDYYQEKYQISKYDQIQICVIVLSNSTTENTRNLSYNTLDSVFQQDYQNYKVYYVDDFTDENTSKFAQKYQKYLKNSQNMQNNQSRLSQKIQIYRNQKKLGNVQNILDIGKKKCNIGSVMLTIDNGDELVGYKVFQLISSIYQTHEVYYSHFSNFYLQQDKNTIYQNSKSSNFISNGILNSTFRKNGTFPEQLRTWMADLLLDVKQSDFISHNNEQIKDLQYSNDIEFALHDMLTQKAGKQIFISDELVYRAFEKSVQKRESPKVYSLTKQEQQNNQNNLAISNYYKSLSPFLPYNTKIQYNIKKQISQLLNQNPENQEIQTMTQSDHYYKKKIKNYKILYNPNSQMRQQMELAIKLSFINGRNISQSQELTQFAKQEYAYYQNKYRIQKYREVQLCVIVLSYMNQPNSRYKRNLDSIFMQNYTNFKVFYVDDFSQDRTVELVQNYIQLNKNLQSKFKMFKNTERKGNLYNQFHVGRQNCKAGSIMIIIEGSDELIGQQAFKFINSAYQSKKLHYLATQSLTINQASLKVKQYSKQFTSLNHKQRNYRNDGVFPDKLRTWVSDLFLQVKQEDILINNQFPLIGCDIGINYLMMQKAGRSIQFVNQFIYRYNYEKTSNKVQKQKSQVIEYYKKKEKASAYGKTVQFNY